MRPGDVEHQVPAARQGDERRDDQQDQDAGGPPQVVRLLRAGHHRGITLGRGSPGTGTLVVISSTTDTPLISFTRADGSTITRCERTGTVSALTSSGMTKSRPRSERQRLARPACSASAARGLAPT